MTVRGYLRGHPIRFRNGEWQYEDNGEPTASTWRGRPCGYCGLLATIKGHDGCLGELPGVINACCGHGRANEAYVQFPDGKDLRGADALIYMLAETARMK